MKMNYPILILRRLLDVRAIILLLVMLGLKMDFVIVFVFLKFLYLLVEIYCNVFKRFKRLIMVSFRKIEFDGII